MAETTKNYGLVTPSVDEFYDVGVHNGNMERLDRALQGLEAGKADLDSPVFTGRVKVPQPSEVPADDEAATVKFVKENGQGVASSVEISEDAQAATGAAEDNVDAALVSVGNSMTGKKVEGLTLKTAVDTETGAAIEEVAKTGAEIFNDYREREFGSSVATAGNAATGKYSHAEGRATTAIGDQSHTEGWRTRATGHRSHAEGSETTASGNASHAEGSQTNATGDYSHAEGYGTTASGNYSHAEGSITEASGQWSHVEGLRTKATAYGAHAEGWDTVASGARSHAEGQSTQAKGHYSHAEGYCTISASDRQHVQGEYNIEDTEDKYAHIVGNGTSADARSNAHTLDWDGNAWFAGNVTVGAEKKTLVTEESLQAAFPSPTSSGTILYSTGEGVRRNIPFLIGEPKSISNFAVERLSPPSDLIAYINFDDGVPKPVLGNFTLTEKGTVTIQDNGYYGKCARVHAPDGGYVVNNRLIPTDSPWTMRTKVKVIDFPSGDSHIWCNIIGTSGAMPCDEMFISKDGRVGWNRYNSGWVFQQKTDSCIEIGKWHDIMFTWTNDATMNGAKIYVDGILMTQFTISSGAIGDTSRCAIFADLTRNINSGNLYFDEFEVYNSIKTPNDFRKNSLGVYESASASLLSSLSLTWTNPTDLLIPQTVYIRRSSEAYPATLEEGVEVYSGSDESCLDETADINADQYYTAWVDNSMVQKTDESMRVKYEASKGYLMLYDHGDECVDVTGGWQHAGKNGTLTKNTDHFVLTGLHPSDGGSYITSKLPIKLKNYSHIGVGGMVDGFKDQYGLYTAISNSGGSDTLVDAALMSLEKNISISELTNHNDLYMALSVEGSYRITMYCSFLLRTDDYTPWLRAGNLNPATYPTLDALLADETAMGVLMNSSAAVDRMIQYTGTVMAGVTNSTVAMTALDRSSYALSKAMKNADWYKFMMMSPVAQEILDASAIKVPTMTSNTAPSGEAFGTTLNVNGPFWKMFDKNNSIASFGTTTGSNDVRLGYKFNQPVCCYKIRFAPRNINEIGRQNLKNFKVQASEDGVNWISLTGTLTANQAPKDTFEWQSFNVEIDPSAQMYQYWCVFALNTYDDVGVGVGMSFYELEFYGKELIAV